MRNWKSRGGVAAVLAAGMLVLSGCQGKYEPIDTSGLPALQSSAAADGENGGATDTEAIANMEPDASVSTLERVVTTETAPVMTAVDETVYVSGNKVNLRASMGAGGEVITLLNRGAKLNRIGYSDTWSKVVHDGRECYISSQYVTLTPVETVSETTASAMVNAEAGEVKLDSTWKYADFSKINSGGAMLYKSEAANRNGIVVCVNAGHGTKGGSAVKTQCHPDGTPKVTGGTTGAGVTSAVAVSGGMTFADGTAEAKVTLSMAKVLKDKLLARGYDVLMIRDTDDVQLDNVARTVIANNAADCHIALHWDSTSSDKGAFYMSVPNVNSYRNMEPVKSNWERHNKLGESLLTGLRGAGVKIFSGGAMEMDLTQTSYSTVPSIDIELGDKASDHSASTLDVLGTGLADGVDNFFGQ